MRTKSLLILVLALAALIAAPAARAAEIAKLARVETPTPASKDLLQTLGLDLTESAGRMYVDVVLWGDEDVAALRKGGLDHTVLIEDLGQRTRDNLAKDRVWAAGIERSALPSGSKAYRTLAQINDELRKLAKENPGLVRLITLPEVPPGAGDPRGRDRRGRRGEGRPPRLLQHGRPPRPGVAIGRARARVGL